MRAKNLNFSCLTAFAIELAVCEGELVTLVENHPSCQDGLMTHLPLMISESTKTSQSNTGEMTSLTKTYQ